MSAQRSAHATASRIISADAGLPGKTDYRFAPDGPRRRRLPGFYAKSVNDYARIVQSRDGLRRKVPLADRRATAYDRSIAPLERAAQCSLECPGFVGHSRIRARLRAHGAQRAGDGIPVGVPHLSGCRAVAPDRPARRRSRSRQSTGRRYTGTAVMPIVASSPISAHPQSIACAQHESHRLAYRSREA